VNIKSDYTAKIAERLGVENSKVHLYWKGRVALYALLKSMGVKAGDEVVMPAFTCVVVPNAVLYMGAKPVYVDINPDTYNMDVSSLEGAITSKTKVILVQNTYGLSTSVREINRIAKDHGVYTIEDCTHGFGGEYEAKPNGTYCDAAFYSTQWNKPYSTGIGGFSLVSNDELIDKLNQVNKSLVEPSFKETFSLRLQLIARNHLLTESNYWRALKFYRYLSSKNLVVGSSSGEEITGIEMPSAFFKACSRLQAKAGVKGLAKLDKTLTRRKFNADVYTKFLKENNKNHVQSELHKNHSFLKYPVRVNDRAKFMQLAEESQIMLGDWFTSPLHPVENHLSQWEFEPSQYPQGVKAAKEVVNLMTELNEKSTHNVIAFLKANIDLISDS